MSKYSDFHDEVVEIVYELCKECKTPTGKPYYSSIFAHHISQDYKPIKLTGNITQHKPFAKNYWPDIWAQISRKQRYDIYEVWHTETEEAAVEDIVFSSLVKSIQYISIICTGENLTGDDAKQLTNLIMKGFSEEKELSIGAEEIQIVELPQKLRSNKANIKQYLKKEMKFV
ncbi:MAG: hypothetical protein A2W22_06765 [Candidatus Levybacteria bacterium RBG_16_35_11]|nr:MAG: hypothetical protein A2W22_06765 [Candidatus Levybacteria bacterium RBG_16_35_11]